MLYPAGVINAKGQLLKWNIIVNTSDIRGAGTDSNVAIEIWGAQVRGGAHAGYEWVRCKGGKPCTRMHAHTPAVPYLNAPPPPPHTHPRLPQDHTAPMKLDTSANNFERGMRDEFWIKAPDLGELTHIVVHKDAWGLGEEWHLASVEVFHPGEGGWGAASHP